MKKYLVIRNPIDHTQSTKLHNYRIKKNIFSVTKKRKYGTNSWRLVCKHKDCKHIAKLNGLCITHGGGYYCQYKNCMNIVNNKYKNCVEHDSYKVRCRINKCKNPKKYCNGLCEVHHTGFQRKSKEIQGPHQKT